MAETDASGAQRALTILAVVMVVAAWTALRWPLPVWMLGDSDWLHQLSGANQILHGEHPFIDWRTDYGPLRYYPSAAFQWLLGERTLAELLLVTIAYTVGYTLLFRLLWQASGRRTIAAALLFPALILAPRLFKYYVLLGPVLCLWAAWRCIERPSLPAQALLAATVVVSGLFRADFGAFGALAAAVAVASVPGSFATRGRALAQLLALGLLMLSPWLLWLALHGAVGAYLVDTFLVAPGHVAAMALPFPRFDAAGPLFGANNALFLLYISYFALPPLAAAAALWPGVCPDPVERRRILTAAVFAQAILIHAAHRSGYSHLIQAIPIDFVLLAWLAGRGLRYRVPAAVPGWVARVAAAVLVIALGASLWAGVRVGGWPSPYAGLGLASVGVHAMRRGEMLDYLVATHADDPRPQVIQYVRRCTDAGERIVALPPWTSLYYFADRMFAGAQPNWSPGFFDGEADQRRWIDTVRRENVRLVVGDFSRSLDGRADRTFDNYSALVTEYVLAHYVPIGSFGPIIVRGRRRADGAVPERADEPPPCSG